jgi:hypothetical protein
MSKDSDWNQSAIDRKDFRHGKVDVPERQKKGHKRKKKPVTVQYRYTGKPDNWLWRKGDWSTWGKYATESDALQAIETQRKKPFWGTDFEFRLKGKKGNVK